MRTNQDLKAPALQLGGCRVGRRARGWAAGGSQRPAGKRRMAHLHVWHWAVLATATAATAFDGQPVGSDSSESPRAVDAATTPPPPQQHKKRYLSSWSYTIGSSAPAYKNSMWTADDFITKDATDGKERAWQNLIMVTGEPCALYLLCPCMPHLTAMWHCIYK